MNTPVTQHSVCCCHTAGGLSGSACYLNCFIFMPPRCQSDNISATGAASLHLRQTLPPCCFRMIILQHHVSHRFIFKQSIIFYWLCFLDKQRWYMGPRHGRIKLHALKKVGSIGEGEKRNLAHLISLSCFCVFGMEPLLRAFPLSTFYIVSSRAINVTAKVCRLLASWWKNTDNAVMLYHLTDSCSCWWNPHIIVLPAWEDWTLT